MFHSQLFASLAIITAISVSVSGTFQRRGQLGSQCRDRMTSRPQPCTCGVFLQSQLEQASGNLRPGEEEKYIYTYPMDKTFTEDLPLGIRGRRICTRKCLELGVKQVQQGPKKLCSYSNRDFNQEKVHLFVKNGEDKWYPTKINSGRAYTCQGGTLV